MSDGSKPGSKDGRPNLRVVSKASITEASGIEKPPLEAPVTETKPISVTGTGTKRRSSILDTERDFIKLFVHHMGENEVPSNFLEWGAVSLIAACLAERTYQFFLAPDRPLFPNMYVFLLGDSGTGKGVTCDTVTSFLPTREYKVATGFEESRTTAQGIMDRLAKRYEKKGSLLEYLYGDRKGKVGPLSFLEIDEEDEDQRLAAQRRLYLVFEELAASLGSGPRADEFTKLVTATYGGKGYLDRTRTYGEIDFSGPVSINILAGSTHRWLKDSVSLDAVLGGFFARVAVVDGDSCRTDKRIWRPKFPPDRDLVRAHLEERVTQMLQLKGEFKLTDEADELGEIWYMERPAPEDPTLEPIFRRERTTMLKLAHIFAVAEMDGKCDFKIHSRHVLRAQQAIRNMSSAVLRVVSTSSVTQDTRGLNEVREFIAKNGPVSYAATARYATSIGIGADQMRRIFSLLSDVGEIEKISGSLDGVNRLRLRKKVWSLADIEDVESEAVDVGAVELDGNSIDYSSSPLPAPRNRATHATGDVEFDPELDVERYIEEREYN